MTPPRDPEEADAVHRRFLPPQLGNCWNANNAHDNARAHHSKNNSAIMKTEEPDLTGKGNGGSRITRTSAKNCPSNHNQEGDDLENDTDADNNENTFTLLKPGQPDYGGTSTASTSIEINCPGIDDDDNDKEQTDHEESGGESSKTQPPQNNKEEEEQFGFGTDFIRRFYRLNGLLFMKLCSTSSILFVFVLSFALLREFMIYNVGLISSDYYRVLAGKDLPGFWNQTRNAVALIVAISFVNSTTQYIQKVITVTFRKILCEAAHRIYFSDIRYYQLNVLDKTIDNPDQRMTQDIDKFCTTYCDVLPKLIVSPFTIGYYCYQGYKRSGWQGPLGCFGFFLIATCINKFLMGPIVNYVVRQEKCEGDFRFLHMLIRVHSESIAFQHASIVEHGKVEVALKKLVDTQHSLYLRQYFLSFSTNFIDYIASIFSYLMLAIPVFSGEYDHISEAELGALISANAFILMYLINSFTSLVDLSGKFTDIAGVTHRISQLLERLNALEEFWREHYPDNHYRSPGPEVLNRWTEKRKEIRENLHAAVMPFKQYKNKDASASLKNDKKLLIWSLENITLTPPKLEEPLISNMNVDLVVGESVIVTGSSSAGKTSILRVLRGLWPYSKGHLGHYYPPGPHGVYVCPQKAYLTWGTLREQISFPLYPDLSRMDDKLIHYYIDKLKLAPVVERAGGLDVSCSWSVYDSLSPGELQRLCLLRIFYHQPVVAVLDEVTSALPIDMEEFIYSELRKAGITMISVGHRESLRKYHDKQLIINSKEGWGMYPIIHES